MHKITQIVLSQIHPEWVRLFNSLQTNILDILDETIINVIKTGHKLCPDNPDKILKCLSLSPEDVSAILVLQDPYPQPGISTGYAAAVIGDKFQPSLNIMIRELGNELNQEIIGFDGTLKHWVDQGIILLNSSLTCEQWKAGSHSIIWQPFMTELMKLLNDLVHMRVSQKPIIFVFLGKQAQSYSDLITEPNYKIFRNHPASEVYGSAKFTGFYNEVNNILASNKQNQIEWMN